MLMFLHWQALLELSYLGWNNRVDKKIRFTLEMLVMGFVLGSLLT